MHNLKSRWIIIIVALIVGCIWVSPNFVNYDKDSFFGKNKMILGLDIQGGLHLTMQADVNAVVQEQAIRLVKELEGQFKADNIGYQAIRIIGENKTEIEVLTGGANNKDAITKFMEDRYATRLQIIENNPDRLHLAYFDAVMIEMKKHVVEQSIEVIRNRIDEFGVAEPSITAQGSDRILVQLPGVKDAVRAKELINRTARLDFRVVSSEIAPDKLESMIQGAEKAGTYKLGENNMGYSAYVKRLNEDLEKQLPTHTKIVFEKLDNAANLETGRRSILVMTDSALSGAQLSDASVRADEMGKPEVVFSFSIEGRKLFADLTEKAAGGFLAIVLDDVVKSAPRVERQIDSDSARITLGGTRDFQSAQNEATFIATALRAGSLPAALEQLEERTVGPSLGGDSIHKAKIASLVGSAAVVAFMLIYYGLAGLVATIALGLNVLFTFAILSSLSATLTLPGVAGIALTVGMAVDANIIIYERIKEELRRGVSRVTALKDGFSHAFTSIFDSNTTSILTALVLMYYGTGPVRGFAVSLMIGIAVSLFTAVFVSRTILDTLVLRMNLNILTMKKEG